VEENGYKIIENMYITEILQYLLWPALIAVTWFVVSIVLARYERKFPSGKE